jgi:thiamine biosynthesis lipoprotein
LRRIEHIMGLPISLNLRNPTPSTRDATDAAFDWLREADLRFSPFIENSEVSRWGRAELAPAEISAELEEILALCAQYESASDGAFQAWIPGRTFDPCGVVKGWAVQRAGQILRDSGADRFCLNAGGDVLTAGEPEPGRPWRVGIRHPFERCQVCAIFTRRDGAIATSATYERGAHILDGHTAQPVSGLLSLTVIADDLTTADATSTAAFAMGVAGIAWAAARPGCEVFAVDAARRVHRSTDPDVPPAG